MLTEFIEPSVELINIDDPLKKIELCGRVCYKSEDKISENSAERMIKALIKSGHHSVLEHFQISLRQEKAETMFDTYIIDKNISLEFRKHFMKYLDIFPNYIRGNVRAWRNVLQSYPQYVSVFKQNFPVLFDDLESLDVSSQTDFVIDPEKLTQSDDYMTVRIITNRGVTHEIVRHRVFSFSQESTRYVNYNGSPIKFVIPIGFKWAENHTSKEFMIWRNSCSRCSLDYTEMIEANMKPQEARDVLNNSVKTEIIMTGSIYDWMSFFNLRCDKNTVHPEMYHIAMLIRKTFEEKFGF